MTKLLIILLILSSAYIALGKFTSLNVVHIPGNVRPTFVSFYNNLLVVGSGGCYIHLYTLQGATVASHALPITCPPINEYYLFPSFMSLKGSMLTVLLQTKFVTMDLTDGHIVRQAPYPIASGYPTLGVNHLKISDELFIFFAPAQYFVLTVSTLTTSPLLHLPFGSLFGYSAFTSNSTTGEAYLCAINPTTFAHLYKKVTVFSHNMTVTNSSVGIDCLILKPMFHPSLQQYLYFDNEIIILSSAGGYLRKIGELTGYNTSMTPIGFSRFDGTNYTYTIMSMGDDNYDYLYQVQPLLGGGIVKDQVRIPRYTNLRTLNMETTCGAVNNTMRVFASITLDLGKLVVATFDDD